MDVFFTVDTEVWCDGWKDIDKKFAGAFKQYVYGDTPRGRFGLPYKIELLKSHGLRGVFFVEPLFATRFGKEPLSEIVGLLNDGNQEVQLHLHTEWADEAVVPLLPNHTSKRQHIRYFSLGEQQTLIDAGKRLLESVGAQKVSAFRAGSFAFDANTLRALHSLGIQFDSSYNPGAFGLDSGVSPGTILHAPAQCFGVDEYPMTVFDDGVDDYRPAQLTSCSWRELEAMLWQAVEARRTSFVILSHNFELLNQARNNVDPVVVDRFKRLCNFLDRNRDTFNTRGFHGLVAQPADRQPTTLKSNLARTSLRMMEQALRRRFG